MPKKEKASTPAQAPVETTTKGEKKPRGAPKPAPPKSIIQRAAKKKIPNKNFQASAYKLMQNLVVEYARNIFKQNEQVLINRKGKTLTPRDLRVLSGIAQTAGTTPEPKDLSAAVQAYETALKANPTYIKKKADRARKREEKKAQKTAETEKAAVTATA